MAINPHRKGGTDVPVGDGGTGASVAATGLTNLGGIDETAHDLLDHTGLPGIGGVLTLVERKEFLADTTSYSFTGLDGNVDKRYVIKAEIMAGAAGNAQIYMRPNSLSTNLNVVYAEHQAGATINGSQATLWVGAVFGAAPLRSCNADIEFYSSYLGPGGNPRWRTYKNSMSLGEPIAVAGGWNEATINVNHLQFISTTALGIGAGSWIELYKTTL